MGGEAADDETSRAVNMVEALVTINGDRALWARPVSWRRTGMALWRSHRSSGYDRGPNERGGSPATMPSAAEVAEEWEVVSPGVVNEEGDR